MSNENRDEDLLPEDEMSPADAPETGGEEAEEKEEKVLDPSEEVVNVLRVHLGEQPRRLKGATTLELRRFVIAEAKRASRPFQGHREARVTGEWRTETVEVPAGSIVVPCTPLTAHLLHPESDDSLTTWNFFDAALFIEGGESAGRVHPATIAATGVDAQLAGR